MQRQAAGEHTLPRVLRLRGTGDTGAACAGCRTTSKGLLLPTSSIAAPCTSAYAWACAGMRTCQKAQGMPTL